MPMEIPGSGDAEIFGTYFDPIPITMGIGYGSGTMFANQAQLTKFRVNRSFRAVSMSVWCQAAGGAGNIDMAIYSGPLSGNLTRLSGASTPVAVAATSERVVTFATPVDLVPGVDYWAATAVTEAVSTFLRGQTGSVSALNLIDRQQVNVAASYPLPATLNPTVGHQNYFWNRIRGS